MSENERNHMLKSKKKLISTLVFIVILGVLFSLAFSYKKNVSNVSGAIVKEGIIPGYTSEQIKEIMQRKADESTFSFEINSRPVFNDGKSEGNLRIANPPYNKYSIGVEIKLDSNNKVLFKSDKIEPNHYIENAKLKEDLKAGEHKATATINAYDIKTGDLMGTSAAKLVIKVNR